MTVVVSIFKTSNNALLSACALCKFQLRESGRDAGLVDLACNMRMKCGLLNRFCERRIGCELLANYFGEIFGAWHLSVVPFREVSVSVPGFLKQALSLDCQFDVFWRHFRFLGKSVR